MSHQARYGYSNTTRDVKGAITKERKAVPMISCRTHTKSESQGSPIMTSCLLESQEELLQQGIQATLLIQKRGWSVHTLCLVHRWLQNNRVLMKDKRKSQKGTKKVPKRNKESPKKEQRHCHKPGFSIVTCQVIRQETMNN